MRRFRFRLERLLRLRAQEVEAARRRLAAALAVERQAEAELAQARDHLAWRTAQVSRKEQGGLPMDDFAGYRRHLGQLQAAVDAAGAGLAAARERSARERQALLATRRRERVLAKLKDRRLAQFRVEAGREHQKFLDELAVQSHGRKADDIA